MYQRERSSKGYAARASIVMKVKDNVWLLIYNNACVESMLSLAYIWGNVFRVTML
jgi:hypothetical protein